MNSVVLPSFRLWRMKGKAMPPKFEPPPKQAITVSGYSPAICICFSASSPMMVWCIPTWLSTDPSVYLQLGVVVASSTASEMAVPSEPMCVGSFVMMSFPARVDIEGEPSTVAPKVRMMLDR